MKELQPINRDTLLQELRQLLPSPIGEQKQLDGSLAFVAGDPSEVIVRIIGSKVSVAVYSILWDGPSTPVVQPKQIGLLNWKRLPLSRTRVLLQNLIELASEIRRVKYRECERCGETSPPEWMHDDVTCQSCAVEHLGVVY